MLGSVGAQALCLGSDSNCIDSFKGTSDGYFIRFDVDRDGTIVKGKVEGNNVRCTMLAGYGGLNTDGNNIWGQVYYTCGFLNIVRMFGAGDDYTAIISGDFGRDLDAFRYQR